MGSPLESSERAFLQRVPRQRITTYDGSTWEYYDCGKQSAQNAGLPPLVCLPGTSGSARGFHLQLQALAAKGYRVLAVQHPVVWSHEEWIHSFDRFLNAMNLTQIHVYGVSLGAYLAQRYSSMYPHRIASLVMTQGFFDPAVNGARAAWAKMLRLMPEFYLKRYILERFPRANVGTMERVQAIDYMVLQLDALSHQEIASRLTLACLPCDPNRWKLSLEDDKITLLDSLEISQDQMLKRYPQAKRAMLKAAGEFPFLSHHEEVSMHLQVHLRAHGVFIA